MFYQIRKKIAAKLAFVIVFVVTIVSVVSTLYFNHINKENLTEYLTISLSNAIYFAEMAYGQPLWDYNESEIIHLSEVILKNKLIIAVNVFEVDRFLTGNVKKRLTESDKTLAAERFSQSIFSDRSTEYKVETIKRPYVIKPEASYIKKVSGNISLNDKIVGNFELFYTEEFIHNAIVLSNIRMVLSFIIIAGLIITVVMVGASKINRPILELALLSEKIARDNDFSIKLKKTDRIDEVGTLFNGFVNMVEQIRQKEVERNLIYETLQKNFERFNFLFSNLQHAIDGADYSMRIQQESEKDELATALNKVMQTLEDAEIAQRNQSWLKNGQAELSSIIGREQDILKISRKATEFIATYVDAKVGTFFVKDETRNDFRLIGTYAFMARKGFFNRFKPGEGLAGQAALEKKTIIFTNVPDDYVKIDSSLGSMSPRNIIVLPVIYEEDVKGVIELGSAGVFSSLHIEFLEIAAEIIAVSINGAIFNEKLSILLNQTQEQAEEMKAQQEELKATNEELEEQTRILKLSEEKLQSQQDELQCNNEELEEKTQILQAQKREIEKSNTILKAKQIEIEEKAAQLLMETQYKSEFLANMSHELRTPLNSLLILANMLAENEEANLTADQIESAASIYRSGQNLLYLINNILDLSKIEAKKMELTISRSSLSEISSHFKSEFLHMAKEKGVQFDVIMGENLPEIITTDIYRLEQIVRNLIGNAIKFTDTGTITLSFQRVPNEIFIEIPSSDTEELNLLDKGEHKRYLSHANAIAISVKDTGLGIPEDKIVSIFEAFKQVDGSIRRRHDGTGLGLSISRELAHLLGGEVTVKSEFGKGSVFTLYVPEELTLDQTGITPCRPARAEPNPKVLLSASSGLQSAIDEVELTESYDVESKDEFNISMDPVLLVTEVQEEETGTAIAPSLHPERSSVGSKLSEERAKTMLIIENEAEFAGVLSDFFKKHGYKTVVASTGEEGLKYLLNSKPTAIILDVGLPDIDGWAVMDQLKATPETSHIPVHMMSGYDHSLKNLDKRAVGYLNKPVSREELNRALLKIERAISNDVKHLLVVEDNSELQLSILKLMGTNGIRVTSAATGEEAIALLKEVHFDCMILDIGLPDISGFELMDRISMDGEIEMVPVIVFTGRDLSTEETQKLEQYASTIILKSSVSMERLIDETALFLHRVEREMPDPQKRMVKQVRDQQKPLKGKRVLVVDDDMRNAFALNKFLQSSGMEVTIANNGEKALTLLEDGDMPDIILMDIMMPVMDGYETMRQIRNNAAFKTIPIIAITAKAMSSDRDECIRCGASDYLSKPLDTSKLLTLLKVWLYT